MQEIPSQLSHLPSDIHHLKYFINRISLIFLLAFLFLDLILTVKTQEVLEKLDYQQERQKCKKSSEQSNTFLTRMFPYPKLDLIHVEHFPYYSRFPVETIFSFKHLSFY